jgi:hypothetical protein
MRFGREYQGYTDGKDRTLTNLPTNSVVISIFAIIILSTIGSMFASGHHIVMGSSEDPKDGKGVAAAVFGAVVVYGVRIKPPKSDVGSSASWSAQ